MKHSIIFSSEDTGKTIDGETVYERKFDISGDGLVLFSMLCEVIDLNPEFRNLLISAIQFHNTHDKANCPHCREGGNN